MWVFCHIIPKGGTRKLICAWRGPHKVTDVLQDGRLYVLDTGQKVHYERLKRHVPAPWDWAAHQPFGLDQNVAIIADPYVEESNEEITSDVSRDSFLPEQLPEASFEMEPTGLVPPRTIQTCTQTALEQGIPRRRFSHFGYPSDSDSEREENEPTVQNPAPPAVFPDLDDLEPLYSDQEEVQPAAPPSLIPSPSGTSAPLLSNPSLTDTLSNFPLFGPRSEDPISPVDIKPPSGTEGEEEMVHRSPVQCSTQPGTTNCRGRPRGRPPGRGRPRAIPSSKTTTSSRTQTTRSRRGPRTRVSNRAPPRILDRAMTLPEIPETQSPPENQNSELGPSSQTLRYQLRANRAPRYKCGTCGSRNCSCVKRLACDSPDHRLARGAVIPARELSMARAPYHPQHEILTVQAQREKVEAPPLVHHLVITVEKTFTSVEREVIAPLEETLRAMHATSPSDCPTYRFKEWTPPHRGGLEFTLHAIIPPLPPSITFGELAEEDSSPEMVRCITAHQLWEKYRIASPPGDIYQPTKGWWLLVTSLDATTLVSPTTLLMCLESLRTVTEPESTLCFHLADIHRGKFLSQHWLQLIAVIFCRQAKIYFLDRQPYTPEKPVTVNEALSIAHDWSSTNMGGRPLRRTVWEDRKAILQHLAPQPDGDQSNTTGKWLITQPKTRPNYLPWITYANTDILQAPGTVILCCPADLLSYSATTRYVIREYGQENIFRLRLAVGTAIRLIRSPTAPWNNEIFLLCTRASNKHPLLHEVLHACLTNLILQLHRNRITRIHLPMYDPERSMNLLPAWYATLRDHFADQNIAIILHDRVYVSIASVTSVDFGGS